ncbi:hypothetical protein AURDEDRAFT_148043 [Auricularia subglabra TFB-10046 SS5]|nr:hypothetical protein AURDEDRAFT_148043 [Auricularia subglabra TFB-10046 SS5]
MVVLAPGNDPKAQQQQPLLGNQQPPPSYQDSAAPGASGPSYAYSAGAPAPHQVWPAPALHQPVYVVERRESATKRFFKALGVGILVWILLGLFFESVTDWGMQRLKFNLGVPSSPRPEDGTIVSCTHGNATLHASVDSDSDPDLRRWKYRSQIEFALPYDADTAYYLFNRGDSASGVVEYADGHVDKISVSIDVRYNYIAAFRQTSVCALQRDGGKERGIGIYTPRHPFDGIPSEARLYYRVVYQIPGKPIKGLSADTHNFAHDLNLVPGLVTFQTISLQSTNGGIRAKTVESPSIDLQTTNGQISGVLKSDRLIKLETTNGHIDVDAQLTSRGAPPELATLAMRTTNGHITGTAALHYVPPDNGHSASLTRGDFALGARSTNGRLDFTVARAPADSRLALQAHTTNAPARVALTPAFEGELALRSTNSRSPSVVVAGPLRDPKRQGREYSVNGANYGRGAWRGKAGWNLDSAPRPEHWGSVEVGTTNGRAELTIQPDT